MRYFTLFIKRIINNLMTGDNNPVFTLIEICKHFNCFKVLECCVFILIISCNFPMQVYLRLKETVL